MTADNWWKLLARGRQRILVTDWLQKLIIEGKFAGNGVEDEKTWYADGFDDDGTTLQRAQRHSAEWRELFNWTMVLTESLFVMNVINIIY